MKKPLYLALLFLLSTVGLSQSSELGNWLIYFGNKQLNDRWNLHHEVQYRNYNAIGDLEQLLLRTGIGYDLTENNNNILLGYGFIHSQNYEAGADEKIEVDEHRVFQQFITRQNFGRVGLQHRYRFEQRWIENQDFRLRFRYFLSLNITLNHSQMEDKTLYLSAYNEIFINNKDILFDRNRLYGGLGYRLSRLVRFELGYMNQSLNNGGRDQVNVITFLNF
ncbi:MAG: DUF2490 domain-containing protein [Owenweeksia sp.]